MHVVATAGHVDHGKSTLVRALTGMEPDRWAEERRRGMTIDLGFAWTQLPSGETLAFVDVPGHERFVPNMLAGVGPVPAAMIVVAADEGWMPQSAEHLAALHALGVRHGLLVVTRCDLADPANAAAAAKEEIATTSLGAVEAVAVSGVTGEGLDDLREALDRLVSRLEKPDVDAPVRLWIDRVFTVKGAGTVVTGTLGSGRLRVNDELDGRLRIRGLQSLGKPCDEVTGVARVAVNLRGIDKDSVARGDALLTPGKFKNTDLVDVRLTGDPVDDLPATAMLHLGSAAVPVRIRPLGVDTARLRLTRPLPLRIGDRGLLRDPGLHHVAGGVTVLDPQPPALRRRGVRAAELATMDGRPDLASELRRRVIARKSDLIAMGIPVGTAEDWLIDPARRTVLAKQLKTELASYLAANPLEPGMPVDALRHRLALPGRILVESLVDDELELHNGRVSTKNSRTPDALRALVDKAFEALGPFTAPESNDLTALGIGPKQIAAAVRNGLAAQIAPGVLLRPGAHERAGDVLALLPQPFTLSEARQALGTTRRVAVPLLEQLDRSGRTRKESDDRRTVT